MNQDRALFGHALIDDSKHPVAIDDLNKETSRGHSFFCLNCHEKMYPTFGPKYVPHFRHIGQKCQFNNYLHNLAKTVFKEEFERCLKEKTPFLLELHSPTRCDRDCLVKASNKCKKIDRITFDLAKLYTSVTLEQRIIIDDHSRRPDILLKSDDGKQLWVEIWVSHETDLVKRNDGPIVELKISTEKDLKQFRNHLIIQSEENERAVRAFNVDYENNIDAVQINKNDCQNCHDYVARPSIRIETHAHGNTTYRPASKYYQETTQSVKPSQSESISPSPESTEWIDLGLPSGTLWAKADVESKITFSKARIKYVNNVPSIQQAEELKQYCSREWNPETKTIIMKGDNGNSISFYCPENDTPFWLNTYDTFMAGNTNRAYYGYNTYGYGRYGNCYHLGKDGRFDINDKEEYSSIGLHLVQKPAACVSSNSISKPSSSVGYGDLFSNLPIEEGEQK